MLSTIIKKSYLRVRVSRTFSPLLKTTSTHSSFLPSSRLQFFSEQLYHEQQAWPGYQDKIVYGGEEYVPKIPSVVDAPPCYYGVLLRNLPSSITEASLKEAVADMNPQEVDLEIGLRFRMHSDVEMNLLQTFVKDSTPANANLEVYTQTQPSPTLHLSHVPSSVSIEALKEHLGEHLQPLQIQMNGNKRAELTFKDSFEAVSIASSLRSSFPSSSVQILQAKELNKKLHGLYTYPSDLTIVRLDNLSSEVTEDLLQQKVEEALLSSSSSSSSSSLASVFVRDALPRQIQVTVNSFTAATHLAEVLSETTLDGKKLNASVIPGGIPTVSLTNLPYGVTEQTILDAHHHASTTDTTVDPTYLSIDRTRTGMHKRKAFALFDTVATARSFEQSVQHQRVTGAKKSKKHIKASFDMLPVPTLKIAHVHSWITPKYIEQTILPLCSSSPQFIRLYPGEVPTGVDMEIGFSSYQQVEQTAKALREAEVMESKAILRYGRKHKKEVEEAMNTFGVQYLGENQSILTEKLQERPSFNHLREPYLGVDPSDPAYNAFSKENALNTLALESYDPELALNTRTIGWKIAEVAQDHFVPTILKTTHKGFLPTVNITNLSDETTVNKVKEVLNTIGDYPILDMVEKHPAELKMAFHSKEEAYEAQQAIQQHLASITQTEAPFFQTTVNESLEQHLVYVDNFPKDIAPQAYSDSYAPYFQFASPADRQALLYFDHQQEAEKALTSLQGKIIDGSSIKAVRYDVDPSNMPDPSYDAIGGQEIFDRIITGAHFNGEILPQISLRFGFVKNQFERALNDALFHNDLRVMFGSQGNDDFDATDPKNYKDLPVELRDTYHASVLCSLHHVSSLEELEELNVPIPQHWLSDHHLDILDVSEMNQTLLWRLFLRKKEYAHIVRDFYDESEYEDFHSVLDLGLKDPSSDPNHFMHGESITSFQDSMMYKRPKDWRMKHHMIRKAFKIPYGRPIPRAYLEEPYFFPQRPGPFPDTVEKLEEEEHRLYWTKKEKNMQFEDEHALFRGYAETQHQLRSSLSDDALRGDIDLSTSLLSTKTLDYLIDHPDHLKKLMHLGKQLTIDDLIHYIVGSKEKKDALDSDTLHSLEAEAQRMMSNLPFHQWFRMQLLSAASNTIMSSITEDVKEGIDVNLRGLTDADLEEDHEDGSRFKLAKEPDYRKDALSRMALYLMYNEDPHLREKLADKHFDFEAELEKARERVKALGQFDDDTTHFSNEESSSSSSSSSSSDMNNNNDHYQDDFKPDTGIADEFFQYGSLSSQELLPLQDMMFSRLRQQMEQIEASVSQLKGKQVKRALERLRILKRVVRSTSEPRMKNNKDRGVLATANMLQQAHDIRQEKLRAEQHPSTISPSHPSNKLVEPRRDSFGNLIFDSSMGDVSDSDYKDMMAEGKVEALAFGDEENLHRMEETFSGQKSFFDYKGRYKNGEELDILDKYPPLADTMYQSEEFVPDGVSEKANPSSLLIHQEEGRQRYGLMGNGDEEELDLGFTAMLKEEEDGKDDMWAYDDDLLRESGVNLRDERGTKWAVTVIDNRVTQKVVRGGYKMSHKAMVVVGNGRGVAGYGVGKGPEPEDALKKSLRNAMKNLHHMDLFQGNALNHNLTGKHNSTHVFIQASKPETNMRASPLATIIMHAFGITSGVVKITGKRSPESNVKAMFKALMKHKSLESIARERGLKFLDLYHQRLWGFGMHDYHDCYTRDVDAYDPRMGRLDATEQLDDVYRINQRIHEGVDDFSRPDAMVLDKEKENASDRNGSGCDISVNEEEDEFEVLGGERDPLDLLYEQTSPSISHSYMKAKAHGYDFERTSNEWLEDRSSLLHHDHNDEISSSSSSSTYNDNSNMKTHNLKTTSKHHETDSDYTQRAHHFNLSDEEWEREYTLSGLPKGSRSVKNEASTQHDDHELNVEQLEMDMVNNLYDEFMKDMPMLSSHKDYSSMSKEEQEEWTKQLNSSVDSVLNTDMRSSRNQKMNQYDELRRKRLKEAWPFLPDSEKEHIMTLISREQNQRRRADRGKGKKQTRTENRDEKQ